jgi:hypothetical protein
MKSIRRTLSKRRGKSQQKEDRSTEVSVAAETTSTAADAAARTSNSQIAGELSQTPRGRTPQRGKLLRSRRGDSSTSPMTKRDFSQLPQGRAPFPNSMPFALKLIGTIFRHRCDGGQFAFCRS